MRKTIVLTGGGTAGHVSVNLGLIPRLQEDGWAVHYIGSHQGMERDLLADFPDVPYHSVDTGKLRRSPNWANLKANVSDLGHVFSGLRQARQLIRSIAPDIVFSKGGFVAVPVVSGAARNGVPVIAHESDLTPGLANRLSVPMAKLVLTTFRETLAYLPKKKGQYLGPIVRDQIQGGLRSRGLQHFGFSGNKPILVILGGSSGALTVNEAVWQNVETLLARFDILHGCGKGKMRPDLQRPGYVQVEFIKEEMKDVLAMADLIISRAGSNAIFEFLFYRKPMVLIPYRVGSRGDQILNAQAFVKQGFAETLDDTSMDADDFLRCIDQVWTDRDRYIARQSTFSFGDGLGEIVRLLNQEKR